MVTVLISQLAGHPSLALANATPYPNRPPIAVDDSLTLTGNSGSINVLANDRDVDGDTLRLVDVQSNGGTVAFTSDGMLTYLADPNAGGTDELLYTIADDRGGIAIATVRLKQT